MRAREGASLCGSEPAREGVSTSNLFRLKDRYREQARSHNKSIVNAEVVGTKNPLWERACS